MMKVSAPHNEVVKARFDDQSNESPIRSLLVAIIVRGECVIPFFALVIFLRFTGLDKRKQKVKRRTP
jgi:hypothetical protein